MVSGNTGADIIAPYVRAFYILVFLLLLTWVVSTCGEDEAPQAINNQTPADIALSKAKGLSSNVVQTIKDIARPDLLDGLPVNSENEAETVARLPDSPGVVDIRSLIFEFDKIPDDNPIELDPGSPIDRIVSFLQDASVEAPQTFILRELEFESGSSRLTEGSKATIAALASVHKAYLATEIRLDGHTDNVGNPENNKVLSAERADAMMQALINAGAEPSRLSAQGFGDERPIDSNDSKAGQRANRRVEVVVLNK